LHHTPAVGVLPAQSNIFVIFFLVSPPIFSLFSPPVSYFCLLLTSGKHDIVSPSSYDPGIFILTQKPAMSKKKVFVARNLQDCYQIYHSEEPSKKENQSFFIRDNFVAP
jgi:hypothetical protein